MIKDNFEIAVVEAVQITAAAVAYWNKDKPKILLPCLVVISGTVGYAVARIVDTFK